MKKFAILITALFCSLTMFSQTVAEAGQVFNEGNTQFKAKQYAEAIKSYKNALKICEDVGEEANELKTQISKMLPKVQLSQGKSLIKAKKNEEAIKILNETLVIADKYDDSKTAYASNKLLAKLYVAQASAASKAKDNDKAIEIAEKAISHDASAANAYLIKALAYSNKKDSDGVYNTVSELLKQKANPKTEKVVNKTKTVGANFFSNEAQVLITNNNNKGAIELLNKALELDNTSENSYYLKASCLNKLNKYDETITTALAGLELESKNPDIRNGICLELARAYEAKGDNANACTYYKEAANTEAFKAEATQKMTDVLKCK